MKRNFTLLIFLSLFASLLAGCSSEVEFGQNTPLLSDFTVTSKSSETSGLSDIEKRALISDNVETKDYKGREFNILSRSAFTYEFDNEVKGEIIGDAIYERNRTVEERFNIKIITHGIGEGNGYNILVDLDKTVLAGDDAYQLASAQIYQAAPGSMKGNYMNLYKVPILNFDNPWWSAGFIEAAAVNDSVYIATGDLSLLFNEVTLAMFFNKQLAEDLKLGNVYQTVKDGKWTLDKLIEWTELASKDINGDGVMSETDQWGLGINRNTHVDCFIYAFELPVTERDENGIPQIAINSPKTLSVFEKLFDFLSDSNIVYLSSEVGSFKAGMFESNKGLFMTSWLGNASVLREMETDFGIIPYPKWDEKQDEYSTYYLDRASCFLIPVTADADFAGRITEVMAAESYKQVIPVFYDKALKSKYTRDDDSQDMIDIITANIAFDFGNIYACSFGDQQGPGHIFRILLRNNNRGYASYYASNENGYKEKLEKIVDSFASK